MSDEDVEECRVLTAALLKEHHLPRAPSPMGSTPAVRVVYCGIGQTNPVIIDLYASMKIYELLDLTEQDQAVETLRSARRLGFKRVKVEFFEKEIWETSQREGGGSGWRRGEETLLRSVVIR